jgi:hypothetical protein
MGCGEVKNHALNPYQCGTAPGCPSCGVGQSCMDHECVSHTLAGPQSGFVGTDAVINASEGVGPCISCDLMITDPLGKRFTGKTGPDGGFALPLSMNGTYRIALVRDGNTLKAIEVNAIPRSSGIEPQKPTAIIPEGSLPCLVLGALALLVLLIIYWRGRRKK